MSMTPVVTSVDGNVSVASHFSNFPSRATDAFTKNWIVLSSDVIANTGTCARLTTGSRVHATRQKIVNRTGFLLNTKGMTTLLPQCFHSRLPAAIVRNNRLGCDQKRFWFLFLFLPLSVFQLVCLQGLRKPC